MRQTTAHPAPSLPPLQDFLTCAFLLTSKDQFFSRAQMAQLVAYMSDGLEPVDLPPPAVLKPLEMWTGKQVAGMLVRPSADTSIFINLEMAEKVYSKKGQHMCPNDGYVAFRNSELISGRLGKVGTGVVVVWGSGCVCGREAAGWLGAALAASWALLAACMPCMQAAAVC